MATSDGMRIYRRSLCFLLVAAVDEVFPGTRIVVDHSLTVGGLFCHILGREAFTADEVRQIEGRMREIVAEDAPIVKQRMPLSEAITYFQRRGWDDKVRLLRYRGKDYLSVYTLKGTSDYFYGYMVPSTGYLARFRLQHYPPGLVLLFPLGSAPTRLPRYRDFPKLAGMFREYGEWLDIVDVGDVAQLNQAVESGRVQEVILVAEALHEQRISLIAQDIAERGSQVRLVLIAGPSSSGKTTFSKRLAIQLLAHGARPFPLALDDYFVNRDRTPLDENGEYDFESLYALDLDLLNEQLLALMEGKQVTLPHYDFATGTQKRGQTVSLTPQHIIVAEGLHGMNPELVPGISPERIYRIYASCLTQLNIDNHNRIPTTDTRLLRRLVRDAKYRGYAAQQTIARWESVRRGEGRNIFPYQEFADSMFNSALVYELAVLKPFAEPLLRQVEPGTMEHVEARRLLAFLQWLLPCTTDNIPDNSLLREFVGGSILKDYTPWQ
jgi:uridine kinase